MNAFANAINNSATTIRTENGDKTYSTSFDACLDLFFKLAASRKRDDAFVQGLFDAAYKQNPELASRILLWARDVRGGAGERKVFRTLLKHLELTDTDRLLRLIRVTAEVGRWDDLFAFETARVRNAVFQLVYNELSGNNAGLVAKWLPREGSKNHKFADAFRAFLKIDWKAYRKLIVEKTKVVETQMCAKDWDSIVFEHVPSKAMANYSNAFRKQQPDRFNEFTQKAVKGEVKINASALFPYDVTKNTVDPQTQNALWKALPDYVPEGVSYISLVDLSGSMTSRISDESSVTCMDVSISLAIYLAERAKSAFKNVALAFAEQPAWIRIPETDNLRTKITAVQNGRVGFSTDLDRAMQMIVDTAVQNNVSAEDMPQYLLVVSDMEFNARAYGTASERTKDRFAKAGYKVPNIVWWNLQSRGNTTPVRFDETGTALVSGFSPAIAASVLSGECDPVKIMLKTLDKERYNH